MKKLTRFLSPVLLTALPLVVAASNAYASSGGEPSISDLTVYWVNFLVYVTLMFVLVRKPIANGWAARRARIQETVASCATEVEKAERELNAIEALTKTLAAEQARAREEIISQAKVEAEGIVTQARERAARIREQSKELLAGESRSAESSFRASLVTRALTIAREKFTKGEFAGRQQAYVDAAVDRAKRLVQ